MTRHATFPQHRKVIIYARYSSDMQSPTSVKDQIDQCQREAISNGWTVVDVRSDEGITGTRDDRPGYQALMNDLEQRRCDLVLFESVDRLSRDQEHSARFYKIATHNEVELYALDSGYVDAIKLGFSSTMAAAFLEALAFKTRRGLSGRITEGKSAGGISYGYRPGAEKGDLVIHEDEAIIIRRIFKEYAEGKSPLKIATGLNQDLIPSPAVGTKRKTSGHWKQNTINGNRERGTGILNNELYVGRRIWNRLRYSKDPKTGRRVSRLNPSEKLTLTELPELRLVDQALWDAAKARQEAMSKERKTVAADGGTLAVTRQNKRRKYLLSGLVRCGLCGGPMTVAGGNATAGKRRYYCANAREKGVSICAGMKGILQTDVEHITLTELRDGLMQDAAFAKFKVDFERHTHAQGKSVGEELKHRDKMIAEQERKRDNLLKAVADGDYSSAVIKFLNDVEVELTQMTAQRVAATPAPVDLPDNLPELYREYVDDLVGMLSQEDVVGRAGLELRELISAVNVHPAKAGGHTITLEGKFLEMLDKTKPAGRAGYVGLTKFVSVGCGSRI